MGQNTCLRKVRHDTLAEAKEAAIKMRRQRRGAVRPYHCTFCGGYHTGRK